MTNTSLAQHTADDDCAVILYSGQDYSDAIKTLIQLADPTARVEIEPTGRTIPNLHWRDDRDWMTEAGDLAKALGMKLHQITDVWVLAPCSCATWENAA